MCLCGSRGRAGGTCGGVWSHRVPSAAHSVFWDLYCAAPDRREACEHSSEAKVFQDYVSLQVLESGPLLLFLFVCFGFLRFIYLFKVCEYTATLFTHIRGIRTHYKWL